MVYLLHPGHDPRPGADPPGPDNTELPVITAFFALLHHEMVGKSLAVLPVTGGTSGQRRERCRTYPGARVASIEVHADVGHGHGSRIYYASWSAQGRRLAHAIADAATSSAWPVRAVEADEDGYPRVLAALGWTRPGHVPPCPDYTFGLILEIGFLDTPQDILYLRDHGVDLARALVRGMRCG